MNFNDFFVQAAFLEEIHQPIFVKDFEGKYLYCNQAFADFLEQPAENIINNTDNNLADHQKSSFFLKNSNENSTQDRLANQGSQFNGDVKVVLKKSILYGSNQLASAHVGTLHTKANLLQNNIEAINKLTSREVEIINLLARGCSVKTIAKLLEISHHTVADHLKSIYRKLKVHSKNEAIYKALSLFTSKP